MLHVIFFLGQSFAVDCVDIDGGVDLRAVDAVVVIAYHFDVCQVGLERSLEKDQNVLFVSDLLALLLDALLLHRQLFDPVCDLIADSCEISSDLLVVLKDLEILSDGLEKGLSELSYFLCVDDAAFE